MALTLFGFEIGRSNKQTPQDQDIKNKTFSIPENMDGAVTIQSGSYYGTYVDLDGVVRNEIELITRYREMSMQPELETAIDDVVNESIVNDDNGKGVELNLDDLKQPDTIKKRINEEFDFILKLLDFGNMGHDIYRRWYIDGRLFYHVVINDKSPQRGIEELRYIDPRRIRKIREIQKTKDSRTGMEIIKRQSEYYLYNERGVIGAHSNLGAKIAVDAVVNVNSGLMDGKRAMVLSYLHKAIKPLNQLRMVEDATVIYRLSRAPERRVFYVDVGNMSTIKAEQYLRDTMVKYRNKLVYDSCLSMDTLIPLLDGRTLNISELQKEFESGKKLWVYSADPVTGKFAPGLVTSAGVTRFNEKVMKLTLDNGKTITCTLDHKFPVWGKGKVEAKDLIVGDSMIPHYTRETPVIAGKNTYQQIFENESKKWQFTHRLVSQWKDSFNIPNEMLYLKEHSEKLKNTVHHINFDRYNNVPDNLSRMNRNDHFDYHRQFASEAGKKGGKITAQRRRDTNTPFFIVPRETLVENGKKNGKKLQDKHRKQGTHPFNMSHEEIVKASKKGNDRLQKLLKDKEFNDKFGQAISDGWTIKSRQEAAERGRNRSVDQMNGMRKTCNIARWSKEDSKIEHSNRQTIQYTDEIFNLVYDCAMQKLVSKDAIDHINNNVDMNSWKKLNENVKIRNRNNIDPFTEKDLTRISQKKGYDRYNQYKESVSYKNHKITSIAFLEERMDVGTLGIDKTEIYHDYHTFALDAGIYTCNSTGEIKDDRKHLSMLEDFWLPRREGSKGTEITTLPGAMNLGELEDVKYFEKKLYRALGVPVSRLESSTGFSLGRTTEITRDELKFNKFVQRLRNKFSTLFDDLLRVQLLLKKVCTEEEWKTFKEDIWYDYKKDNNFTELKEAELITARMQTLQLVDPYVGRYYSAEWVKKNILQQTDEDIEEINAQMANEAASAQPTDANGNPVQLDANGQPVQAQVPANAPPPTPSQDVQQQQPQQQQEDGSTKEQEDPLIDKKKMRFINDTMEIA
ncbi:hypothetical protein EB001_13770 [bacterium]|nr:hypothetical protein [bacterium]